MRQYVYLVVDNDNGDVLAVFQHPNDADKWVVTLNGKANRGYEHYRVQVHEVRK